jgi:quaternary ammonium compound-resistance protein SugE
VVFATLPQCFGLECATTINMNASSSYLWGTLLVAGLLETVWAVGLKYTRGFTQLGPTVLTVAAMIASISLLAYCVRSMPVGTAYAVWTGIGVVGTALFGIVFLREPATLFRLGCLATIVVGISGLRLAQGG